ncbi:hypothetical protein TorRG33x02_031880 [Trema orientale]|uniref:Uncharacterized protein n=1 Tax=Trema orientale TaxID=63057 RepID=A0A2P5FT81_TREOI|nr:hypothetical protein TorRG33x02_031880 [Trema orientale]
MANANPRSSSGTWVFQQTLGSSSGLRVFPEMWTLRFNEPWVFIQTLGSSSKPLVFLRTPDLPAEPKSR